MPAAFAGILLRYALERIRTHVAGRAKCSYRKRERDY